MSSLSELKERRSAFGPLVVLDYREYGLIDAHRALGMEVRAQVWRILTDKLVDLGVMGIKNKIRQGRSCQALLEARLRQAGLISVLRQGIEEYLACLTAWAQGAGLADFEYPGLIDEADGQRITGLDLAWLLQHDNLGCQTGLYRCEDGGVIFWHAEEDVAGPNERFDRLRIAKLSLPCSTDPIELQAFIYPDLLPGPAFAWRSDGYIQAADTLILLSLPEHENAVLVNVVSWLTLRLGAKTPLREIVQALSPFWDGYALNTAFISGNIVIAGKCEFARDQAVCSNLPESSGSFLIQVNVFCDRRNRALRAIEALPEQRQRYHVARLRRARRILAQKMNFMPKGTGLRSAQDLLAFDCYYEDDGSPGNNLLTDELEFFYALLGSRSGGEAAFANLDVRAWLLARISPQAMNIRVGPGAVILS
jgi:hypothetical protein